MKKIRAIIMKFTNAVRKLESIKDPSRAQYARMSDKAKSKYHKSKYLAIYDLLKFLEPKSYKKWHARYERHLYLWTKTSHFKS